MADRDENRRADDGGPVFDDVNEADPINEEDVSADADVAAALRGFALICLALLLATTSVALVVNVLIGG